jgi:hypothetical protein
VNRDRAEKGTSEKPGRNRNGVVPELGGESPRHIHSLRDDAGEKDVLLRSKKLFSKVVGSNPVSSKIFYLSVSGFNNLAEKSF